MADQTAQELIEDALLEIGVKAVGETPTDDEMQDALRRMKIMFRAWAVNGMTVYVSAIDTHTLSQGTTNYTIGTGGTINTARPAVIKEAYVNQGGIDYTMNLIGEKEYAEIADKDLGHNYPTDLWYQPEYPLGKIWLWPPGGGTLNLHSYKQLSEPSALTTSIAFPGEYDEAILYNLAIRLAPGYGKEPTPFQVGMAAEALDNIIDYNMSLDVGSIKPEVLKLARRYHINSG
jgi:hypothetical protein